MKIIAFVDMHGSMDALKKIAKLAKEQKADYIICSGDITIFEDNYKGLMKKLNAIGKPVLYIHGNHESERRTKEIIKGTKNIIFMHKKTHEHEEYCFVGWGGGGFSKKEPDFEEWTKKLKLQGKKTILITHAPPHGTTLDNIWGESAGSKSISEFIKREKPVIAISGHLHENAGQTDKIGKTQLINPGPWGLVIEL